MRERRQFRSRSRAESSADEENATATLLARSPSDERLRDALIFRILGWRQTPDRYIKANRSWIPRWRFTPLTNLQDAFDLLEIAASSYSLRVQVDGRFEAEVFVDGHVGRAFGEPKARTIAVALARALGIDISSDQPSGDIPNCESRGGADVL